MAHRFEQLARTLGGELKSVQALTGGVSAAVHLLELAETRYVVREPRQVEDGGPLSPHAEFALLEHLARVGIPVAEPVLLDDPFIVMAFVEGDTGIDESRLAQMARCLAEIHAVDLASCPPLPDREDPVAGLLEYLPDVPAAGSIRRLLTDRPTFVSRNSDVLLHGDYWPANVIWQDDAIAAVIDWEDAALGDPLCDLAGARLELMWALDRDAADTFLREYLDRRSIDDRDMAVWEMFVSSAALSFMSQWGLPPETEATRRREATAFFEAAAHAFETSPLP